MMQTSEAMESVRLVWGVSEHTSEITAEMLAIAESNSRALAEITKTATCSRLQKSGEAKRS